MLRSFGRPFLAIVVYSGTSFIRVCAIITILYSRTRPGSFGRRDHWRRN